MQGPGEIGGLSDNASSQAFSRPQVKPAPEHPALQKELPDMTAEDYEASGDLYLGNEDYTMAFVQYEKSLQLKPGNARVHYKQGMLFLHAGKHEDAVKSFQKVLEKEPAMAAAHEGMGTAYFEMRRYEEAEKHFRKAVEIDPTFGNPGTTWGTSMIFKRLRPGFKGVCGSHPVEAG
jgi:tetratricopeptide (TPR) repeat protein